MKKQLSLEFIGADTYQKMTGARKMFCSAGLPDFVGSFGSLKPYCAELTGVCAKYKFSRKFLEPNWDYSNANSVGSRGVMLNYILESGKFYEIRCHASWRNRSEKYLCEINSAGDEVKLHEDYIISILKMRAADESAA